jgi:D-3-phosphoglycerate dehydrogenase
MNILITDKMANEAIVLLKKEKINVTYKEMTQEEILKQILNYDALMVRGRTKVTKNIIKNGANGKLRVIGRAGIGVDNIDIEAASKYKIPVVNAPTGATSSVAELAIGLMLSLSRYLPLADFSMKNGEWIKKQLKGYELNGKILGLIGCGNIGRLTAKFAKIFNMKVIGYDPYISKEDLKNHCIEKVENIEDIMKNADYISLHLPHMKSTHHIINKEMIQKMKRTAYIINCSRGGTVDEDALYDALMNNKIAGAGIDVFEQEPPKNSPLLTLENVILTPHIGANTHEGQTRAGTVCAEQIIKVLNGQEPNFCVNKKMI